MIIGKKSESTRRMTTENKNTTNDDGEKKDAGAGPEQWSIGEKNTPYELNEDNTAKDPLAFRDALSETMRNARRLKRIKTWPCICSAKTSGSFRSA